MPTEGVPAATGAPLVLAGAGGHAKVVLDALLAAGFADPIEVRDDRERPAGDPLWLGRTVRSPIRAPMAPGARVHVAIGPNRLRLELLRELQRLGATAATVVHPAATVSSLAGLGEGGFVAAGAVIAPAAVLGPAAIVNHSAVVDHDCRLGDSVHVAPNCTLGGGVIVGDRTLLGAGSIVLPGRRIGRDCTVGAGAVVTTDLPDGCTVTGIPARLR
jgi:sugar O-acyltransferase (sialic acid O-acetyltransferase NeuD family)